MTMIYRSCYKLRCKTHTLACGSSQQSGKEYLTNYCPNCGAKMLVEIVTCKDCKYCVMTEVGCYCDRHIHRLDTHIDKYCADAERRTDDANVDA